MQCCRMVCWQECVPISDARWHAAVHCGRRPSWPHWLYVAVSGFGDDCVVSLLMLSFHVCLLCCDVLWRVVR